MDDLAHKSWNGNGEQGQVCKVVGNRATCLTLIISHGSLPPDWSTRLLHIYVVLHSQIRRRRKKPWCLGWCGLAGGLCGNRDQGRPPVLAKLGGTRQRVGDMHASEPPMTVTPSHHMWDYDRTGKPGPQPSDPLQKSLQVEVSRPFKNHVISFLLVIILESIIPLLPLLIEFSLMKMYPMC